MSRFYDALKEAGRHSGESGDSPWAGSRQGDDTDSSPKTSEVEDVSRDAFSTPSEVEQYAAEEMVPVEEPVLVAAGSQNGEYNSQKEPPSAKDGYTSPLKIHIAETVPLLPHVTEMSVVERYRRLRTKLLQQHAAKPFKTLLVASPGPQEGKTITTLNLALSFGMLPSFRILVVDGDLRRGSIAKCLGQENRPGLSELIDGTAALSDVVVKADNIPVHFILHGSSTLPRAELLNSSRLRGVFQRMAEHFDLILIDSPPVNLLTDAQLLAGNCDAVLLIARAFSTTRKAIEQAIAELHESRIVGTVLNGGTRAQIYRRTNGYYDGK